MRKSRYCLPRAGVTPFSSVESNQGAAPYCVHRLQVVDSIWKVDHRAIGHNRARRVLPGSSSTSPYVLIPMQGLSRQAVLELTLKPRQALSNSALAS